MYRVKQRHWLLSIRPYGDVWGYQLGIGGQGGILGHLMDYLGKAQSVGKYIKLNFDSS